ncbi:MAG: cell filamentation protein Fic, partial [Bacteroidetes bacterium GWA2_31_9]
MSKKENKEEKSLIRSSTAEYLTFIAATGEGGVDAIYADENIWLSQKMMGTLYNVETHTVNYHLKKIFSDSELEESSVVRNFRITATDGKNYNSKHYNLSAIIAVGYKVNSERAVQFRKWATQIVQEFTIKGFAMDDERLKNDGTILGKKYFEEQLQRIREIRLSERKFYQKITDIYSTAIDYDVTAQATKRFFATVQNKLHWAIHGQTATEVIVNRANHQTENMGLTTWKDAPNGKIQKFDVSVAKNYLSENEMQQLQRLVSAYLDIAEDMAIRQIPMTMEDWESRLNKFIEATDREILQN